MLDDYLLEDDRWSFVALKPRYYQDPTTGFGNNDRSYKIFRFPVGAWVETDDLDKLLNQTAKRYCKRQLAWVIENPFYIAEPDLKALARKPFEEK